MGLKSVKSHPLSNMAIIGTTLLLASCASIKPQPLQIEEVSAVVHADRAIIAEGVDKLEGVLSIEEAIARAVKYNVDRRYKIMEEAFANGVFEVGKYDMLPKMMTSAGYRDRNNYLITRSKDSVTGAPSLANPFISSSQEAVTSEIGLSWSLLDFGQSYYAAKQNADRVLIAAERKQKAMHTLIQDVRTAYWRVVAAQKLESLLVEALTEAEAALQDAKKVEDERIRSPLEPLRYQRQLLENIRLLEMIQQELSTASIELASLTNLPLVQKITVKEPVTEVSTTWLNVPIEELEEFTLMRNPEIREGIYNARIARQETRRTLLKLFPGISFNYASRRSTDDYLINNSWNEVGAQISYNLLGLLSAPSQMRLAEAGVSLADQKRLTTQIAALTQLHIARLQYANAAKQFDRADKISNVDQRISEHVFNQQLVKKQSKLERVAQQTASILSQLRRYQALSNAQSAESRLQATLGLVPTVDHLANADLQDLTKVFADSLVNWKSGKLPALDANSQPQTESQPKTDSQPQ